MKCKLVDVFATEALSGNGLTVFYDYGSLTNENMQSLTQEMRQFESIFVSEIISESSVRARVFTIEEELDFAGHPILGLAAHLHEESNDGNPREWCIELNRKSVRIKTEKTENYFRACMDQGSPVHTKSLNKSETEEILSALNLTTDNLARYPLEVVSTGLPYLIVPISKGIDHAKICSSKFASLLERHGAKFIYVLDVINLEGRTWDNDGAIEDIATGSAAGPAAAYLCKYDLAPTDKPMTISQGRFMNRPSEIEILVETTGKEITGIFVTGEVVKVADISFIQKS